VVRRASASKRNGRKDKQPPRMTGGFVFGDRQRGWGGWAFGPGASARGRFRSSAGAGAGAGGDWTVPYPTLPHLLYSVSTVSARKNGPPKFSTVTTAIRAY
jgi:hypothetical protein